MKIRILIAFCITMITNQVYSQKGLRLGVGNNLLITQTQDLYYDSYYITSFELKRPIGVSLIVEYGITDRLMFRSGLEYKFQNSRINNEHRFRAEFISVPLLLDYQLYRNEVKRYSFGVSAGVSIDKVSDYYEEIISTSATGSKIRIITFAEESSKKIFEFSEISGRFGLNFKKEFGNKHLLNLYAMYYTPFSNYSYHLNMVSMHVNPGFNEYYSGSTVSLLDQGLMIGANYTFGPLR